MIDPPPTAAALVTRMKKRDVGVPKFLRSLYDILENENTNIISWTSDGVAVQVLDRHTLESAVLPKYFKHSKFTSFQRQLNYFGFKKNTRYRSHMYTFTHPYFRQGRKDLLCKITRHYGPEDDTAVSVEEDEAMEKFLEAESPSMEDVPFSVDPMLHLNAQDMDVLRELIEPEPAVTLIEDDPPLDNLTLLQSLAQFPGMLQDTKRPTRQLLGPSQTTQPPSMALDAALTDSIIHDLKDDQQWPLPPLPPRFAANTVNPPRHQPNLSTAPTLRKFTNNNNDSSSMYNAHGTYAAPTLPTQITSTPATNFTPTPFHDLREEEFGVLFEAASMFL